MIVSSVAPPTNRSRCERTVTRAFTFTPMPSCATPSIVRASHVWARGIDDLRIDARSDRLENGLAGALRRQIDGAGPIEIERDPGFVRGDQGQNHVIDVAAREVVRLEWIARDVDARFYRGDAVIDDEADRHLAQAHPNHFAEADWRVGNARAQPEPEEIKKNNTKDEREDREHRDPDEVK